MIAIAAFAPLCSIESIAVSSTFADKVHKKKINTSNTCPKSSNREEKKGIKRHNTFSYVHAMCHKHKSEEKRYINTIEMIHTNGKSHG